MPKIRPIDEDERAFLVAFGKKVKRLRERNSLGADVLARRAGYSDMSSIYNIEAGRGGLTFSRLPALAQALGVEASALIPDTKECDKARR